MISLHRPLLLAGLAAAASACLAGCAAGGGRPPAAVPAAQLSAEPRVLAAGPVVEAQDLVAVTDRMARSILVVPAIANAKATPRVVLDPVVNDTRYPFDPTVFLARLRTQLNGKSLGRVRFLDRAMMRTVQRERALRRSGAGFPAAEPTGVELGGADFFLSGRIERLVTPTAPGIGDTVVYRFRLTDGRTGAIVWEDSAELREQGLEDAAYR
jgi:PBP1b-binding outer membrane lipoprotein LpoB